MQSDECIALVRINTRTKCEYLYVFVWASVPGSRTEGWGIYSGRRSAMQIEILSWLCSYDSFAIEAFPFSRERETFALELLKMYR